MRKDFLDKRKQHILVDVLNGRLLFAAKGWYDNFDVSKTMGQFSITVLIE